MKRPRQVLLGVLAVSCAAGLAGQAWASNWVIQLASGSSAQARTQAAPAAPATVASSCVLSTAKQIKVTWAAVTHATTYNVFQSTTSATSGYSQVASGLTGTSWTSGTLSSGRYWYEVTALIGTNWQSAKSAATGSTTISSSAPNCSQP